MSIGGKREGAGRPFGARNKSSVDIKGAFAKHAPELIKAVLKLCRSADENIRLRALALAFDRGFGKAPQPLTGADLDGPVLARIERVIIDDRPASPEHQDDKPKPLVH